MNPTMDAPSRLRCEYATNPIGIGEPRPRLSWWVNDDRQGAKQTAYQIRAGSTPNGADRWDSGRVASGQNVYVPYAGPARSGDRVYWQVRTWDAAGEPSAFSEPAFFEIGLLSAEDWHGQWVSVLEETHPIPSPAAYFRRDFEVTKPIRRATLYATARGVYVPYANGRRVGDDRLTPGWTNYHVRIRYQAYDVTEHLRQGGNALGLALSDGWYAGHMTWTDRKSLYGDRPAALAQLHLRYDDGTEEILATDDTWRCTTDGPVTSASFLHGDTIDARKGLGDWSSPGYDDTTWHTPAAAPRDGVQLSAQVGPAVRKTTELAPIERWRLANGNWVFDLGQNMAGVVRLTARGHAGQTLVVRHGEMLQPGEAREVYYANLRSARATDTFVLAGVGGPETFEPPFTLHGFRYVEVAGFEGEPPADAVTGLVYHSDTEPTGAFECSHEKLNQLQRNIVWGQRGNFVEVPTDCPQRDERLGWLGDAQVFARTAAFNMDVSGFFARWLVDVCDAQLPSGTFPDVVPDVLGNTGAPAWSDAGVICPWVAYLAYADVRVLKQCYPSMAKFVAYLTKRCEDFVYPDFGYGDWLAIGSDTPKDLIGTAYSAYSVGLMRNIATVLGKADDARAFGDLHASFKAAFNREFVTPAGRLIGNSQTADVLALRFGLVDGPARQRVVDHLCRDIERRGVLTTGFVGVNLLLPTLSDVGRDDLAYKLLTSEKFPSWLFSVNHGATTIWERWDGWTPEKGFQAVGMNSFNHYAYGSCGEWMYARIGGIDFDEAAPGYKHVLFRPTPGVGVTWAKASLDTMHGRVRCEWAIAGDAIRVMVTVPPNTTASYFPPAAATATGPADHHPDSPDAASALSLEPGTHSFTHAYRAVSDPAGV
jgi:alpha-L-rhamnosidase